MKTQLALSMLIFAINTSMNGMIQQEKEEKKLFGDSEKIFCDERGNPIAVCPESYVAMMQAIEAHNKNTGQNVIGLGVFGVAEIDERLRNINPQENPRIDDQTIQFLAKKIAPFANPKDLGLVHKKFDLNDFHVAARAGNLPAIKAFLARRINVNQQAENGYTALHFASRYGRLPVVEALLQAGAHVEVASTSGKRAVHFAASYYQLPVVQLLARARADLNATDNNNNTALHCGAINGDDQLIEFLISQKVRYSTDLNNRTPLQIALHISQDPDPAMQQALAEPKNRDRFARSIALLTAYQEAIKIGASKQEKPIVKEEKKEIECSICLDTIADAQIQFLACTHQFHKHCISEWLKGNHTCPVCRAEKPLELANL